MPIERAIKEYRFAFGSRATGRAMEPPPNTLPLEALPQPIAQLFERAFTSSAPAPGRPTAREWRTALERLNRELDVYKRQVFWPQTGQYVNETRFVTDSDAAVHLECVVLAETVAEIALLTDGLQTLALHYQHQQAHTPFFRPMFHQLRAQTEPGSSELLTNALARFLASPAVNERTHDDKTLILATRLSPLTPGTVSYTHLDVYKRQICGTSHPRRSPRSTER